MSKKKPGYADGGFVQPNEPSPEENQGFWGRLKDSVTRPDDYEFNPPLTRDMGFLSRNRDNTPASVEAAAFMSEAIPIIGDAIAAKEVWDEINKAEPNWALVGALGGATVVGLIPGVGDAAASAIRSGAKKGLDVVRRVEVDPNAMGSLGGNVRLQPEASELPEALTETELPFNQEIGTSASSALDPERLRTDVPTNDSRANKLGFTETVYHSSVSPDEFTSFIPGSTSNRSRVPADDLGVHVGTPRAAAERSYDLNSGGFTMEMRARTNKPVSREYLNSILGREVGWENTSGNLTEEDLRFLFNEYRNLNYSGKNPGQGVVAKDLRTLMANDGYTHVPYTNNVEDVGSTSYIMLTDGRSDAAVLRDAGAKFNPEDVNNPDLRFNKGGMVTDAEEALGFLASPDDPRFSINPKDSTSPTFAIGGLATDPGGLMTSPRPKARPPMRPKARPSIDLKESDILKIERVVLAEANTEGVEGRDAVRGVILNRLASGRFGDTVEDVLIASQFEPVRKHGSIADIPATEDQINRGVAEFADYAMLGEDSSDGSTFFQNEEITKERGTAFDGPNPKKIGNHTFYSGLDGQEPVEDTNFSHNVRIIPEDVSQDDAVASLSFALGGLATAQKGIITQEGLTMAEKRFQLDRKKADTNNDGELSVLEEETGEAVQKALKDDELVEMAHGGMACDMGLMGYDEESGNEIPIGSNPENVRDNIDAKLSVDEYVLPADVVKWHGLKHIMEMQDEAKMGLMAMSASGFIQDVGEEEEDYETEEPSEEEVTEDRDDVPSEDVEVEVATVKVDDMLDDDDEIMEISEVESALPVYVKKQKYAFMS